MSVFIVTAGYDHTIRFWEAPSGRCYRTIQYTESVCGASSPCANGRLSCVPLRRRAPTLRV